MLKKSLTFMLVGGFIATSSYAFQPFEFSKKARPTASHKLKHSNSQKYTDFSGSWTGACSGEGSEFETIIIKNDDMKLRLDNEEFTIGGSMRTTSFAQSWGAYFDHFTFFWNQDRSQLIGSGLFATKSLYTVDNEMINEVPISSANTQFAMSLKDDKLIIEGKSKVYLGTEEEAVENFTCTYTRSEY